MNEPPTVLSFSMKVFLTSSAFTPYCYLSQIPLFQDDIALYWLVCYRQLKTVCWLRQLCWRLHAGLRHYASSLGWKCPLLLILKGVITVRFFVRSLRSLSVGSASLLFIWDSNEYKLWIFSYFSQSFVILGLSSCRLTWLSELVLRNIRGLEFQLQMSARISSNSDVDMPPLSVSVVGVRKL